MTNMKATKRAILSSVLATVLCFAMLAGTTFAWFTDSVTSSGNIIQSGTLDAEMYWANGAKDVPAVDSDDWNDASSGPIFTNTRWEPGYTDAKHIMIVNNGNLAFNYKLRIVANGIVSKLADVIDVYYFVDATKIELDQTRDVDALVNGTTVIKIGTLAEVLGAGESSLKVLHRYVNGTLEEGKTADLTLVFQMRKTAGDEYQNLTLGSDFSIELLATQAPVESDSFDNLYDANVPHSEIPYALVRPLNNLTIDTTGSKMGKDLGVFKLDTGYQFEPTIFNQNPDGNNVEDDVDSSEYKHYHADFYVYADRDVKAGTIGLAGYYDAWCQFNNDKWVAFVNDGLDIPAGEGIRLVKSMGVSCVTYKNICQYGNDGKGFQCGAFAVDPEALAGTTLTVELRLYKTNVEWTESSHGNCNETGEKDFITIGTFKYTFCDTEVATADELKNAIANGAKGIRLTEDVVLNDSPITVPADGQLTIDLNGKTLSGVATSSSSSNLIRVSAGASLTLTGGGEIVFGATTPDTNWGGVGQPAFPGYANNTISCLGELIIDGVTVKNVTAPGGASYAIDCYQGSNLVINSGVIDGVGKCAIRMFCNSNTLSTNVTINGGTITGKRAIWVQLPGNNINNVRPVNLTINGGEFICTSDADVCIYSYSYGDSFANTNITITGGTFTGDVCFGGGSAKTTQENVTVTGGTFNGELGRYLENDGWVDIAKP